MWRRIALLRRSVKMAVATTGSASRVAYACVIQGGPALLAPLDPVSHCCTSVCAGIMPQQVTFPLSQVQKIVAGTGLVTRAQADASATLQLGRHSSTKGHRVLFEAALSTARMERVSMAHASAIPGSRAYRAMTTSA